MPLPFRDWGITSTTGILDPRGATHVRYMSKVEATRLKREKATWDEWTASVGPTFNEAFGRDEVA
jgi:hypothetical protein